MAIRDHQPIKINKFSGLFSRGTKDATPPDHFTDCLNVKFNQDEVAVRDGFNVLVTFATPILRAYIYKIYGQADRILFLDNTGKIWDSTNLGAPILNIPTMTDFVFVNIYGRAYISPTNGSTGLPGFSLYVYLGSGIALTTAGVAPTGSSMVAVNSASSGHVETGFHLFAVVYETLTGFLTAPGPTVFASLTATGGLSVDLSGIPTGTAVVVARRILATKIIQNYNGNQNGYQFFFVPNGRIADNVTTSLTVSFFDADLLTSGDASYLFDQFSDIPAMLWLTTYNGRLIGGGENANPSVVRVSERGQPEAINELTGLMNIDPANTSSPVTNGQEYRGQFYLFKKTRTYSTNDNNDVPTSWQTITLDEGIGTYPHGIATVLDTGGINIDKIFIVSHAGLMLFTGTYLGFDLSWKIDNIWKRINVSYFSTIQIALDPFLRTIYIAAPLDSAVEPTHILVMDYTDCGFDLTTWYQQVKWSIWTIDTSIKPTAVLMEEVSSDPNNLLVASSSNNIYKLTTGSTADNSMAIPTPFIQTALFPDGEDASIFHFAGYQSRVIGSGSLVSTWYGEDSAASTSGVPLTLSTTPGKEPFSLTNFNTTRAMLKLSMSSINEYFKINRIILYAKELYKQLPL